MIGDTTPHGIDVGAGQQFAKVIVDLTAGVRLLAQPLDKWTVSLLMTVLVFVIESLVVRHYGLAVIFITPLTIFLAEATRIGQGSADAMIQARFFDTVVGSLVGLAGGICLHSPKFREVVGGFIRRLMPTRLLP